MKQYFRLTSILFGGQKSETPVAAGVPENIQEDLPVTASVSTNGRASNRFQQLPEYKEHGRTSFAKHLKFKVGVNGQEAEYIDITPAMAKEMLTYNENGELLNRPCSATTVRKYAQLMKSGLWGVNGRGTSEPIIFSDKHRLLSGQHRLHAVVESGVTQRFLVVFGEPDGNFAFIDQGRRRTSSDIFAINRVPNYAVVSAAMRWIKGYDEGTITSNVVYSPQELFLVYQENQEIQLGMPVVRALNDSKLAPSSVMLAMHHICARKNRALADEFFLQVASQIGLKKGSSAYKLYKRLRENASSTSAKLSTLVIAAYTIKAWNEMRSGGRTGPFKWRTAQNPNESFPRAV